MWGEGEPRPLRIWGEEKGLGRLRRRSAALQRRGILGPPSSELQEHVGRQEQGRGVSGKQPGSGKAAGKNEDGPTPGQGTKASGPGGERKGRRERERGHEEGGSPWPRGHAPGKSCGTREAEHPDTLKETADLPPGRGERRAAAPGRPCAPRPPGPDPPRGASLLPPFPPSLPPSHPWPVIPRPPHSPAAAPEPAATSAAACASAAAAASLLRPSPGGASASRRRCRCRQNRTPQNGGTSGTYHRRGGPRRRGRAVKGNVPPRGRPPCRSERSAAQGRAELPALQRPLGLGSREAAAR